MISYEQTVFIIKEIDTINKLIKCLSDAITGNGTGWHAILITKQEVQSNLNLNWNYCVYNIYTTRGFSETEHLEPIYS